MGSVSVHAHPRDQGAVIMGWLIKLAVTIGVVATILYDAGAVGVAHLRAMDTAPGAAMAASTAWTQSQNRDPAVAVEAAQTYVASHGAHIVPGSVTVDADGTVHLRITSTARTVLLQHLGPLAHFRTVTIDAANRMVP